MALRKTLTIDEVGIEIADAYCRIDALKFRKSSVIRVDVGIYADAEAESPVRTKRYPLSIEDFGGKGGVSISGAYEVLKVSPEWVDSEDC